MMVNVSDYVWVFIILAILLIVCCCATWTKKYRNNNANANQTPVVPGPPGARPTNPNHVRILNVEAIYSPPSPGIRPADFSPPPVYMHGGEPSVFRFENEYNTGNGLTNRGHDIIEDPPSYDDVIKADIGQTSSSRSKKNSETEDTKL